MNLSAFLYPLILSGFLIVLVLLASARISINLNVKDGALVYRITGSILWYIKIFEIKSGIEKKTKKRFGGFKEERGTTGGNFFEIIKKVLKRRKLRIIHIDRLIIEGTYSIGDAAANAILFGLFITLWQFLLIFLNEKFKLEYHSFKLIPDFQKDKNDIIFHAILRATVFNLIWLYLIGVKK